MALKFTRAQKSTAKLRLGIVGPAGAGKTFSALSIATHLGGPIAVVDTERQSASLYADKFEFDTLNLDSFSPETYVEAIKAAEAAGYKVLIIDSLSMAWAGKDGALEQADRAAKRSGGNKFAAWRDVTPMHNRLVDAMLMCNMHVIATMRARTEWVLEEDERGRKVPKKIGLEAIQRQGMDFEFTIVGEMNLENELTITKTRCSDLTNKTFRKPGKELADILMSWLSSGTPAQEKVATAASGGASITEESLGNNEMKGSDILIGLWTTKINAATSQSDLESLTGDIRALSDDVRRALMPVYKEKKAALAG